MICVEFFLADLGAAATRVPDGDGPGAADGAEARLPQDAQEGATHPRPAWDDHNRHCKTGKESLIN